MSLVLQHIEKEQEKDYILSELQNEIDKFKFIKYKNVHVFPKKEIKIGMDLNGLNLFFENRINFIFKEITKNNSDISLEEKVLTICQHRESLERKLLNLSQ